MQLLGTVFFNLSTFAAMKHGFTTHQTNARVWGPDALGSICFLIASEFAYAEVCHRWVCLRNRTTVMVDRRPEHVRIHRVRPRRDRLARGALDGLPISARISNGGTALGGLCFLIGALALMPEAAAEQAPGETR